MEYNYDVPAEIAGWMNGIGCAVTICDGEIADMVEFSIVLSKEMPHYVRKP